MNSALFDSRVVVDAPQTRVRRAAVVIAASLVIAATSHVVFPLPFSPVPLSLQPLAVLLAGLLLGPVDGALALFAYLAEGAAGLPVFSPTGPGGIAQILGPTGGFLLADPLVAFTAGWLGRRLAKRTGPFLAAVAACTVGISLLFIAGAAWLDYGHHLAPPVLWAVAVAPFLPGEAVKIVIAAGIFRAIHPRSSR